MQWNYQRWWKKRRGGGDGTNGRGGGGEGGGGVAGEGWRSLDGFFNLGQTFLKFKKIRG